jgi:hypothetical protein
MTERRILQAKFRLSGVWQFKILNLKGPTRSVRGVRARASARSMPPRGAGTRRDGEGGNGATGPAPRVLPIAPEGSHSQGAP